MILNAGVNPLGLTNEALIAWMIADRVYNYFGRGVVATSMNDGVHGRSSYHPDGDAIDLRTRYFETKAQIHAVAAEIKGRLGDFYDVVVEKDHIHIEFDRRRAEAAARTNAR